ncbi:hypothetical protein SHO565_64620 [Streptomyces sp. HO565]
MTVICCGSPGGTDLPGTAVRGWRRDRGAAGARNTAPHPPSLRARTPDHPSTEQSSRCTPDVRHSALSEIDRARPDSKHPLIADRHGTPLTVTLTGGNRHDITQLCRCLPDQVESAERLVRHLCRPGSRGAICVGDGDRQTLVSIRVAYGLEARLVLFVVPTLVLAAQTALVWRRDHHLDPRRPGRGPQMLLALMKAVGHCPPGGT